ncbi:MAG: hypothetical protein ACLR5B_01335 [Blautia sp.]
MRKRDMEKNKGIAFKGKAWNYAAIFLLFLAVSFFAELVPFDRGKPDEI